MPHVGRKEITRARYFVINDFKVFLQSKMQSLFDITEWSRKEEFIERIVQTENIRIERILSSAHVSPENEYYDQDENEFVSLLQGSAKLEFEGGKILSMKAGDYINIPKHKKHRVIYTSANPECVWLLVYYP